LVAIQAVTWHKLRLRLRGPPRFPAIAKRVDRPHLQREARRATFARLFATEPETFLLDEQAADLDQAVEPVPRAEGPLNGFLSDPAADNRRPPDRRSSNRGLILTLVVSVSLHLAGAAAVLLLLHSGIPVSDQPDKPIQVELVMEEHKGDARPAAVPQPPVQTQPRTVQSDAISPPPVRTSGPDTTPPPPQPMAAAQDTPPAPEPPPQPARQEVKISLQGTDSPSDARAWGDQIIPAKPDAVFHNRPPAYPDEAVLAGERGTVVVVIHVSPAGLTSGVDVVRSSGYVLLDQSVQETVMRWRFLPAVKDGQPIASEMKMGFVFDDR
jgi:TonB family protein